MKLPGYYSSGQFARMANVSVRTIRFYDKQNILKPSYVTEAGARFYTDSDVARLQQILLLKYLGFSLEDIRKITIKDTDWHYMLNSLTLQHKLIQDRMEQMQMVEKAIDNTIRQIRQYHQIDWSQMLELIHLTNAENRIQKQYQDASNISARIQLHKHFSKNPQGWFPWLFEQCSFDEGQKVLELGCGDGALWYENADRLPGHMQIILSDISEGMLRDARRNVSAAIPAAAAIPPAAAIPAAAAGAASGTASDTAFSSAPGAALNAASNFPAKNSRAGSTFIFDCFDCAKIPDSFSDFDRVIANHLLFYCDHLEMVLAGISRVLAPGGQFICSTYGSNHMREIRELVSEFDSRIVLSDETLYEKFGLDNGMTWLRKFFSKVQCRLYDDAIDIDQAQPMIEYILSCHGNQNQFILDRYDEFRDFVQRKTAHGFHITKEAGIFIAE